MSCVQVGATGALGSDTIAGLLRTAATEMGTACEVKAMEADEWRIGTAVACADEPQRGSLAAGRLNGR